MSEKEIKRISDALYPFLNKHHLTIIKDNYRERIRVNSHEKVVMSLSKYIGNDLYVLHIESRIKHGGKSEQISDDDISVIGSALINRAMQQYYPYMIGKKHVYEIIERNGYYLRTHHPDYGYQEWRSGRLTHLKAKEVCRLCGHYVGVHGKKAYRPINGAAKTLGFRICFRHWNSDND